MARLVRHALDQTYGTGDGPGHGHGPRHQQGHGHDLVFELRRAVPRASAMGRDDEVDAKRYAQAGLVGVRGKWGARLADAVARRTQLSADTLKALVGAYLVISRLRSLVKMAQRASRVDR
jgi:hypothetical protein